MATASPVARVALVTGANQGIGLEIVRQLCRKFEGTVLLAARNVDKGQSAVMELMSEGLQPVFLPLDVDSEESILAAKEAVQISFGRLDVLINNAAVMFRKSSGLSLADRGNRSIMTNYHGVLNVINAFWPLLQPDSRIVNMGSGLGRITHVSKEIQEEILAPDLTTEKLTTIMDRYVGDCQLTEEEYSTKGWPPVDGDYGAYSVSKIGVNRLTELFAEKITADANQPGVLINTVKCILVG
ncbi:carbonyl reductase [NADPH] 3-like isoform X2 [Halichondria panicea]|uniref:carbonyl reductase [NADPH] 3-like isoform X2 n=1 Tax=Halichondria panicea TaxID=6063 RepID=UPI00312B6D0B